MRQFIPVPLVLALALPTGCSLKNVLPGTAVLTLEEQARFDAPSTAKVTYTGAPRTDFPVLPLQVFGLQYAVDVVFVSQHPDWDMHEYARLDAPDGSVWVAKDSDLEGSQTIVADVDDLESWLPEVPVPRLRQAIEVQDKSDGRDIDLSLRTINPAGDITEIWARGTMPKKPRAKRNGNTMGHSQDVVAAVLDLERFGGQLRGGIAIDEQPWPFERVLGLVPFRFLLRQTQGGVAITNYRIGPAEDGFALTRPSPGTPDWPTRAEEAWAWDGEHAQYSHAVCAFDAHFVEGGLSRYTVQQKGDDEKTFVLHLEPALPDLRRPFEGTHTSRFRMDVNGQTGHGTGIIDATWTDENTVSVRFRPSAPRWLADRPMEGRVHYRSDGTVDVQMHRVEPTTGP